jgi:hypothetical protein
MKIKKYIGAFIISLTTVTMISSCTKQVDVQAVSALLPGIQLSSVGMFTSGPYALPPLPSTSTPTPVNVIQVVFGASTTNKGTGAIDVVIYDASVKPANSVPVETLHFNSWSSNDTFNTPSLGSVSYTTIPSEYPNTTIYQGSILLKIPAVSPTYPAGSPLLSGKTYNVKITIGSSDATPVTSSITTSNLFTIQ